MNRLKEEYEAERKKRLAELFKDDLENDNSTLRRGWLLSTNPPYPYTNPKTFLSYSMDGKPGYILEDLLKYGKAIIGDEEFTVVSDLMKDKEWLEETTEGYGDVSFSLPCILSNTVNSLGSPLYRHYFGSRFSKATIQ